jgi:YebC/PmpR family DNA-binding regulatory protein
MAGHTRKWAKVKRKKKKDDRRKSKIWAKLSQEIEAAVRESGADPTANVALSQALERAREEDMAKDTIERAIKRGLGELEGEGRKKVTYEGYAPHGVAVFVEAETDNINRTVKDLRNLLTDHGGNLGKDGSVAYLFEQKGRLVLPTDTADEMTLFERAVEAGAEDVEKTDGAYVVTTPREAFSDVEAALDAAGLLIDAASLLRAPTTTVSLAPDVQAEVASLIAKIHGLKDVEAVYTTLRVEGMPLMHGPDAAPAPEH